MITPFEIYAIMLASEVQAFFIVVGGLFLVIALLRAIGAWDNRDIKSYWKSLCSIAIACFTIATFIPDTKTVVTMVVAPVVLNNKDIQNIPQDVLNVVKSFLNETKK